jgi:hypothetical protein
MIFFKGFWEYDCIYFIHYQTVDTFAKFGVEIYVAKPSLKISGIKLVKMPGKS